MFDRTQALQSLLNLDRPLPDIVRSLHSFSWDSDGPLVTLEPGHLASVIGRFQEGRVTEAEVETWANAVESREDIGFEPGHELFLSETIFQLANPTLTMPLTPNLANELIRRLTSVDRAGLQIKIDLTTSPDTSVRR